MIRPALQRPPARPATNGSAIKMPARTFTRSRGTTRAAVFAVIYGTGGIGKSSLAADAPGVVFLDIENGTNHLDVERIEGLAGWDDLIAVLQSNMLADAKTIVLDSGTLAEEWCRRYVIANIPHEKGHAVDSIEGYGWGKGYKHIWEKWRELLGEIDRHRRQGRNFLMICHDRIGKVPNPTGEDYIRYEPRLQDSKDASILAATKEAADEVWFVNYDVHAGKDGKASGGGSRTVYTSEAATHLAKTRAMSGQPLQFPPGGGIDIWTALLNPLQQQVAEPTDGPPA